MIQTFLFLFTVAAGVIAGILTGQPTPLLALAPLLMALAALAMTPKVALAAGFAAGVGSVATAIAAAYQLDPLNSAEWLRVGAFLATWAAILTAIALTRRRSGLAAAALVLVATPAFIAIAVPLVRSLDIVQRSSVYLAMRDGVRIAADLYLPRGFETRHLPALLHQTRYFRRTELRWPYRLLFDRIRADVRRFVTSGYAYVYVDVRGSGASFGSRTQEWSDDEIRDGGEIVDWIIRQPWSSGSVGATGISYDGTAAEMLLANQHPAVKACAPRFSLLDAYDDIGFPGGLRHTWFIEKWASYNDALDRNALAEKLQGFPRRIIKGVAPVDGHEALLAGAIREHADNYALGSFIASITYRDDSGAGGLTMQRMSTYARPEIPQSGVPIYSYSGWYDGAYNRAAAARFLTYRIPGSRLILGPWDHGGRQNISPNNAAGTPIFDHEGELLRFFDFHLKGIDNGFAQERPVRYFTMGAETWRESDTWPPAAETRTLHFADDRGLADAKPAADEAWDEYTVDLGATSGSGSRWRSYFNPDRVPIGYPDRAQQDQKLLAYTSTPMAEDSEITGYPTIAIWIASSAADGQFFAYLEDVSPDGRITYITEGLIRGLHRAVNPAGYWHPDPSHSFRREDSRALEEWEPEEISFVLLPTSFLVRKGHAIRVALAGTDRDQFEPLPGDAPVWRVYRDTNHPSRISLPIVAGGAGRSTAAANRVERRLRLSESLTHADP
ncbi:MAG: CocE/NonD family hydrolase [Steroidobacteraceae bacterium]